MSRAQKRASNSPGLQRVKEKAKANPSERFTSLAHHLSADLLLQSYESIDGKAAPGVDGVTKAEYGAECMDNLNELHHRLKSGKYRASPVLRVQIPKEGGGMRPLGLPTLEDKIVQGALVCVLNCIYESDFKGFSYGFRPGRSGHDALRALSTALQKGKVNWVLDADISRFFDSIGHKELMSLIERRVADRSILRLIGKWLAAGVVEKDGRRTRRKRGTPQGGVISPLLANIFLHYVLDDFVDEWRRSHSTGEVYIVRYADDFVVCFENKRDADALLSALADRFAGFGLELNRDKTRLIRFGRHWDGDGRPKSESFDFLGFTHYAGRSRSGSFLVMQKTSRKRFNRSVKAINAWCKENRHAPVGQQWRALCVKLRGHYNYFGVRGNFKALARFRYKVFRIWYRKLLSRSRKPHKERVMHLISKLFVLPPPTITHPEGWLECNPGDLLRGAGCGNTARPDL